jgi:class 3 adenylate cyclase
MSVMFSDIRGFTTLVENLPPEETTSFSTPTTLMFDAINSHGGVVAR